MRNLSKLFIDYLRSILADEGFSRSATDRIFAEYTDIRFSKTNNKSVLGSMNDLAFHYKYRILESGGIHSPAIPGIIKKAKSNAYECY